MTKYVKVTEAPEELGKDEFIVKAPEFIEEINKCARRAPKNHYTTSNYMRDVSAAIGDRYMHDDFSALMTVNTSRFRGIPFETPEDVNEIVKQMLGKSVPEVFDRYVDFHIKSRPIGTKLIYFLGDHTQSTPFTVNGIDEIKSKDVDVYLGKKKKKVVGKPAVKDVEIADKTDTTA